MSYDQAYEDCLDHAADELRLASELTAALFTDLVNTTCTRLPALAKAGVARIRELIETGAQLDAVLALIKLELPQWQLRRLILDGGQWHCSLSRQPNLPIALDDTADGQHERLVLAILTAFVEALRVSRTARASTVPTFSARTAEGDPVCCDNFS